MTHARAVSGLLFAGILLMVGVFPSFAAARLVVVFQLASTADLAPASRSVSQAIAAKIAAVDGYDARLVAPPATGTMDAAAAALGARDYVRGQLTASAAGFHVTIALVSAATGAISGQQELDVPSNLALPTSFDAAAFVQPSPAVPAVAAAPPTPGPITKMAPLLLHWSAVYYHLVVDPGTAPTDSGPDPVGSFLGTILGNAAGNYVNARAPALNAGAAASNAVSSLLAGGGGSDAGTPADAHWDSFSNYDKALYLDSTSIRDSFNFGRPTDQRLTHSQFEYDLTAGQSRFYNEALFPKVQSTFTLKPSPDLLDKLVRANLSGAFTCYARSEHPDGVTVNVYGHKAYHLVGQVVASPTDASCNGAGSSEAWVIYLDPATLADGPAGDASIPVFVAISLNVAQGGQQYRYALKLDHFDAAPTAQAQAVIPPFPTATELMPLDQATMLLQQALNFDAVIPYNTGTMRVISKTTIANCHLTIAEQDHFPNVSTLDTYDVDVADIDPFVTTTMAIPNSGSVRYFSLATRPGKFFVDHDRGYTDYFDRHTTYAAVPDSDAFSNALRSVVASCRS